MFTFGLNGLFFRNGHFRVSVIDRSRTRWWPIWPKNAVRPFGGPNAVALQSLVFCKEPTACWWSLTGEPGHQNGWTNVTGKVVVVTAPATFPHITSLRGDVTDEFSWQKLW